MTSESKWNHDEDPLVELRRYRDAMARRFKTTKALGDHLRTVPSAKELLAALDAKAGKGKAGTARKTSGRRSPRKAVAAH